MANSPQLKLGLYIYSQISKNSTVFLLLKQALIKHLYFHIHFFSDFFRTIIQRNKFPSESIWQSTLFIVFYVPQHFLNFLPLLHGHGSLRPTFCPVWILETGVSCLIGAPIIGAKHPFSFFASSSGL